MQITAEMIVAGICGLGAVAMGLQRAGLISFGRPQERRDCAKKCSDHELMVARAVKVSEANKIFKEDIKDIKDAIIKLHERLDSATAELHEAIGYIRAKHNNGANWGPENQRGGGVK